MNWDLVLSVLLDGIFAAIAAIGFAVISNPPRKAILISALLAAVGHAFRFYLLNHTGLGLIPSTLCASFTIGLFSIYFARLIHCPAEVFSFPSLLPMIPGMYAYKTILALIRNGLTTAFVLVVLAIGVSLPLFIFHKQAISMTRFLRRKKE